MKAIFITTIALSLTITAVAITKKINEFNTPVVATVRNQQTTISETATKNTPKVKTAKMTQLSNPVIRTNTSSQTAKIQRNHITNPVIRDNTSNKTTRTRRSYNTVIAQTEATLTSAPKNKSEISKKPNHYRNSDLSF